MSRNWRSQWLIFKATTRPHGIFAGIFVANTTFCRNPLWPSCKSNSSFLPIRFYTHFLYIVQHYLKAVTPALGCTYRIWLRSPSYFDTFKSQCDTSLFLSSAQSVLLEARPDRTRSSPRSMEPEVDLEAQRHWLGDGVFAASNATNEWINCYFNIWVEERI
jgi:hypothetical protein